MAKEAYLAGSFMKSNKGHLCLAPHMNKSKEFSKLLFLNLAEVILNTTAETLMIILMSEKPIGASTEKSTAHIPNI